MKKKGLFLNERGSFTGGLCVKLIFKFHLIVILRKITVSKKNFSLYYWTAWFSFTPGIGSTTTNE